MTLFFIGYISKDEMRAYMTSVFKVIYATDNTTQSSMSISPSELARITSEQAFLEGDVNHDGQLDFKEFQKWYSQPKQDIFNTVAGPLNFKEARKLTNLENYSISETFLLFSRCGVDEYGMLSYCNYERCFNKMLNTTTVLVSEYDKQRCKFIISRLFRLFDTEECGHVDYTELCSGLSILCRGVREEKARAAFTLYDLNGDNFISLEEMTLFFTCLFKVVYEFNPEVESRMGVSSFKLGVITAEEAFQVADLNHDGKLSFDEFVKWFNTRDEMEMGMNSLRISTSDDDGDDGGDDGDDEEDLDEKESTDNYDYEEKEQQDDDNDDNEQQLSLEQVRQVTQLGTIDADSVFEIFAEGADDNGSISRTVFISCFEILLEDHISTLTVMQVEWLHVVINRIYDVYDDVTSGLVDFSEVSSGLSIFCKGSKDDQVRAAFALYDFNGDGCISKNEMTRYLTAVYRMLYTFDIHKDTQVCAEELAKTMAEQAFNQADVNRDGKLTLHEFQVWYALPTSMNILPTNKNLLKESVLAFNHHEIRRLTKLELYSPMKVFETLAEYADGDGNLSQEYFNDAFHQLIERSGQELTKEESQHASIIITRLFYIFDTDGNGLVDFSEISSGLSVLCGGK